MRKISDAWRAALIFAEEPGGMAPLDPEDRDASADLAAAVSELDSFPTCLWREWQSGSGRRLARRNPGHAEAWTA